MQQKYAQQDSASVQSAAAATITRPLHHWDIFSMVITLLVPNHTLSVWTQCSFLVAEEQSQSVAKVKRSRSAEQQKLHLSLASLSSLKVPYHLPLLITTRDITEVVNFQTVRPDIESEHEGLQCVSIGCGDYNFLEIFARHHIDFLDKLKGYEQQSDYQQSQASKKKISFIDPRSAMSKNPQTDEKREKFTTDINFLFLRGVYRE